MIQSRTLSKKGKRRKTPPSSRGPGRGPLKAQTGVRIPMGAQKSHRKVAFFFSKLLSPQGRCYSNPHGGTKKSSQGGFFLSQTGVSAGEMLFESPWGHKEPLKSGSFFSPNCRLRRGDAIRISIGARKSHRKVAFFFPKLSSPQGRCAIRLGKLVKIRRIKPRPIVIHAQPSHLPLTREQPVRVQRANGETRLPEGQVSLLAR